MRGFRIELGEIESVLRTHPRCRPRWSGREDAAGDDPPGGVRRRRRGVAPSRASCAVPARAAARAHGAGRVRVPRRAAADAQRQGRPPRAARARRRRRPRSRALRGARGRRWRRWSPGSGPRCSGWTAWASTTISSIWAGTRCSPPRWWRACARFLRVELPLLKAVRGAHGHRPGCIASRALGPARPSQRCRGPAR